MSKSLAELQKLVEANELKLMQLQAIHKQANVQDANLGDYAAAQAKADQVLMQHGGRAGQPLLGEPITAYRKRLASEVQKH